MTKRTGRRAASRPAVATSGDFLTDLRSAAQTETVTVSGRTVTVRGVSARAFQRLMEACRRPGAAPGDESAYDNEKLELAMIGESLFDEAGARLVPAGREAELADLPNGVFTALRMATLRVNGMVAADPGN